MGDGVLSLPPLDDGAGVAVDVGLVDTTSTVFSFPLAVIKNSPTGTPSVSMSREQSPFESAVTFIDVAIQFNCYCISTVKIFPRHPDILYPVANYRCDCFIQLWT